MLHFRQNSGFTLIEVIVVVSLISIILFFSMPRFQNYILLDETKKVSRWIIGKVNILKDNAVLKKQLYILHASLDNNRLWSTSESMTPEELKNAEQKAYELPDKVKLLDIEYVGKGKVSFGEAEICFYKNGYSDKVFIHIEDNENERLSFLIEPFLSKVKLFEHYEDFGD